MERDLIAREPMATEICARVQIEKPSRKLLRDDLSAFQFAHVLADAGFFSDAVRIVAHVLTPRNAVWWAIQCARQNPIPEPEPELEVALRAAEKWVTEMSEEARYAARPAAENAGFDTAAGCAAMAAFTSGPSLAPADQPPIPPDPTLPAQLVTGSIIVSSLLPNPTQAPARYRKFIDQGIQLYRDSTGGSA